MKNPDRDTVSELTKLPNIGKAVKADLELIGINHPKELIGKDAFELYNELCITTGVKHDPCMIDVFMSVINFMEGGEAQAWYAFTAERKRKMI